MVLDIISIYYYMFELFKHVSRTATQLHRDSAHCGGKGQKTCWLHKCTCTRDVRASPSFWDPFTMARSNVVSADLPYFLCFAVVSSGRCFVCVFPRNSRRLELEQVRVRRADVKGFDAVATK